VLAVAVYLHRDVVATLEREPIAGLDRAADAEVEGQTQHVRPAIRRDPGCSIRGTVVDHDDVEPGVERVDLVDHSPDVPLLVQRRDDGDPLQLASLLCRQRLTDTTSGFRAVNRRGICLFARDYPHDYPEVEAIVMAVRQRLRLKEVPVSMRLRDSGHSSITTAQALYYVVKVTLAMMVGLTRKNVVPLEDQ